jgi:hypothetical protein
VVEDGSAVEQPDAADGASQHRVVVRCGGQGAEEREQRIATVACAVVQRFPAPAPRVSGATEREAAASVSVNPSSSWSRAISARPAGPSLPLRLTHSGPPLVWILRKTHSLARAQTSSQPLTTSLGRSPTPALGGDVVAARLLLRESLPLETRLRAKGWAASAARSARVPRFQPIVDLKNQPWRTPGVRADGGSSGGTVREDFGGPLQDAAALMLFVAAPTLIHSPQCPPAGGCRSAASS